MIELTGGTDKLEFVLAAAHTTTAPSFSCSWKKIDPTLKTTDLGATDGVANGTTDVALCDASGDAATGRRQISSVSITNRDTVACTVTVQRDVSGANKIFINAVVLAPNETLQYEEEGGWKTLGPFGELKPAPVLPGSLLNSVVKTTGTTFTTGPRTTRLWLRMRGGGGAGGGVTSSASTGAGGGGGSEGGWLDAFVYVLPSTAYTYAVGGGGSGASGANGGDGGDTTFTIGSTTYTANRGKGGLVGTAAASGTALGGVPAAVSTGDANNTTEINGSGAPGRPGFWTSATIVVSGAGGGEGAGNARSTTGTGNAAIANTGSGGGGAVQTSAGGAQTGGAGAAGYVQIDEYA